MLVLLDQYNCVCVYEGMFCRGIVVVFQPMRVLITGPPACGKTTVVEQLCTHFKLHHVKIKDVIDEAIAKRVNNTH